MSFALPTDLQLGDGVPKPPAAATAAGAVTTRASTKKKEKAKETAAAPAAGSSSGAVEPTTQAPQPASGPKPSATINNSATQATTAAPASADPAGDAALLQERIRYLEGLLRQQAAPAAIRASAPAPTQAAGTAGTARQPTAQPASAHTQPPAQRLVATHDQIEGMRLFAEGMGRAPNQANKTLPAIIPGKKADPYQLVVPEHVIRVIRAGGYVPYTVLSAPATAASTPALDASLLASLASNKPLDRTGEDRIDQRMWMPISRAIEAATRAHLGDQRANALQRHHDHVINLASTYDWPAARLYDIKEREAYAADLSLDISVQCSERTAMIANEFHARRNRCYAFERDLKPKGRSVQLPRWTPTSPGSTLSKVNTSKIG